ncbi:DUF6879 family protein [Streptomyces sp. NPDC057806]|uniref:DUF6879 family protein n=1 Tax=Streptomyces sp. NPDC057806 TaxID=3346255 RepID=UPI0036739148
METRRAYTSNRKGLNWARFQSGQPLSFESDWYANVRTQTQQGKRFERVRLVDAQPTEHQRFLLATGLGSVEAGEDIGNLCRAQAQDLRLPDHDF